MKPSRLLLGWLGCAASAFAADAAPMTIPAVSGAMTIDGQADERAWQGARVFPLASSEFGAPFPGGGEIRIATRGGFLCLSARAPEPDRVVAHSTGHNPEWWSEDLIRWNIRVQDRVAQRRLTFTLSVNAVGAYQFQGADEPPAVLVAAHRGAAEWGVEVAIPLERFGQIGLIDVQRIRAARPNAPELRWYWPATNDRTVFQFAPLTQDPAPEFHPESGHTTTPDRPAGTLDWIPKNVLPATHGDESRMVEKSLRVRMSAVAEEEKREWQKVDSQQSWERFRDQRLDALRRWIGPWPERSPLRAVVTHRADYGDGFVIENIVFESRPHLVVTANLYLPVNPRDRIPAIVVVHSHHAPKTQSELQDLGMTWARSGTAVLVMDQLCAGERSQSQPWPRESYYGRYTLGNQLLLAGESLMKWMVWDLMRGIDVLLERPYIDSRRIVLLGAVAGGGDPAAVTAALDPRVAAVIPFNFGEAGPEEHYTEGPRGYPFDTAWPGWGGWETTRSLPRSAVGQFFPWLLCASVAPRPFLYSFEIDWPEGAEREPAWARYRRVFEFYGARDHLAEIHGFGPFPGPGECTNVGVWLRRRIYPVLTRLLQVPTPAAEYHKPLPDSELMCLTPTVAAERRPETAAAIALAMARDKAVVRSKTSDLRAALKAKLGDIEPPANPSAQVLSEQGGANAVVQAVVIETEPGIRLPMLVLKPVQAAKERAPAILAIAQEGKTRFLEHRSEDLMSLLRNGTILCLADLRGTGEVSATSSRGPTAMDTSETELMLGRTMLGSRLRDARTVVRYLMSRPDVDPARVAVWGDSFAEPNPENFAFDQSAMQVPGPFAQQQAEPMGALIALLTALYEPRVAAVAARGGLISFLSILEDRFCHVPQDVVVPGILEVGDVADIFAGLGSRPVLAEAFVDGRNRVVRYTRLQSLKASPRAIVREAPAEPALPAWLAAALAK